jgi:thioredoxin reductase
MTHLSVFDSIVVGGGPAGLSAALLLGRCHRSVAVIDEGRPRNEMSLRVNCFLGVATSSPLQLLEAGRAQLASHPSVKVLRGRVEKVARLGTCFKATLRTGEEFQSRSLIIATGLIDQLPEIEGVRECYGKSVFPCPYCDGWENSGGRLGALGSGEDAAALAVELRLWSESVALFVSGPIPGGRTRLLLDAMGVHVYESPVASLSHSHGKLAGAQLQDGTLIECSALFVVPAQVQHNDFWELTGCPLTEDDQTECDESGTTPVPGLYVAGNAKRGLQLAMVAASDGLKCAAAANEWLLSREHNL